MSQYIFNEYTPPTPVRRGTIQEWQKLIQEWATRKGWMASEQNDNVHLKLMLMHSEISEALEILRDGHDLREVFEVEGKPEGFFIDMADLVIRVLQLAAYYDIDLEEMIDRKMKYNETRPFMHGKKM